MTPSTTHHQHSCVRHRHENRRTANPWRVCWNPSDSGGKAEIGHGDSGDSRVCAIEMTHRDSGNPFSRGDAIALTSLLASAAALAWLAVCGADHVLSEMSRYTTMDILRVFGGLP